MTRLGFPGGPSGKESTCQCRRFKRWKFDPWIGKIPWRRAWRPIPVFLPGESRGQRSLEGCSSWGRKGLGHDWVPMHTQTEPGTVVPGQSVGSPASVLTGLDTVFIMWLSRHLRKHTYHLGSLSRLLCTREWPDDSSTFYGFELGTFTVADRGPARRQMFQLLQERGPLPGPREGALV